MGSIPYLHFIIKNPKVDWFVSLTSDDDVVVACKLELWTEITTKAGTAQEEAA